jgi:hypothetical protein
MSPFAHMPADADGHFKLYYYAAVLLLLHRVIETVGSQERAFEMFPFLSGYHDQLCQFYGRGAQLPGTAHWQKAVAAWEAGIEGHLPLRALREVAALDYDQFVDLMVIGLVEADGRFGVLFETLQGISGQARPTLGLLINWLGDATYHSIRRFALLGLILIHNQSAPRPEWVLQFSPSLWDALHTNIDFYQHRRVSLIRHAELPSLASLPLLPDVANQVAGIITLVAGGELSAVVVRGIQNNGRRQILGALAKALDQNLLIIEGPPPAQDRFWLELGPLATALCALPVLVYDVSPGEVVELPRPVCYEGCLGIVIGKTGGITGPGVEGAIMLTVGMPEADLRQAQWQQHVNGYGLHQPDQIARQLRITSGYIAQVAHIAQFYARLEQRNYIVETDVTQASRTVNRHALDTLASQMDALGSWEDLIIEDETRQELATLEKRCRYREHLVHSLSGALAGSLNAGVRALLQGPSGTGKTMAARILAAMLNKDLYRVDLAAVVNKYIGETEKNLNQVLARAEELDVMLLLDEGDALLTRRTSVQTANDRYANLETNYLLQRLEDYEGILLITTNAADYIDSAFERRMDVVVTFKAPDAAERWAIWNVHLPHDHRVDDKLLRDVARRCQLTGGQIRNAVLHASLLALDANELLHTQHLKQGVLREYRKSGEICPISMG